MEDKLLEGAVNSLGVLGMLALQIGAFVKWGLPWLDKWATELKALIQEWLQGEREKTAATQQQNDVLGQLVSQVGGLETAINNQCGYKRRGEVPVCEQQPPEWKQQGA